MEVLCTPSWFEKLFGVKETTKTYVGCYVWRELPSGKRAELFFEGFLQELCDAELTRRKYSE